MTGRILAITVLGIGLVLGGSSLAQGPGMMGKGSKRGGMMAEMHGEMHGMMGMRCLMMMSVDAEVKVEKMKEGAAIRITSSDPIEASRIQKCAEIMRLVHELHQLE